MVIGLHIAVALGWIAWSGLVGYAWWTPVSTGTLFLGGLSVALWNGLMQSMLVFMWISLTRQIREHIVQTPQAPAFASTLHAVRNRMLLWTLVALIVWMTPPFWILLHAIRWMPDTVYHIGLIGSVLVTGGLTWIEIRGSVHMVHWLAACQYEEPSH